MPIKINQVRYSLTWVFCVYCYEVKVEGKGYRAATKPRKLKGRFLEAFRRKKQSSELALKEPS